MGPFLVPFRALEDAEAFDALEAGIFAGALAAASLAAELRSLPRGAVLGTVRPPMCVRTARAVGTIRAESKRLLRFLCWCVLR